LDVVVRDAASDGFDADFAEGKIVGGLFERIGSAGGGDALDLSGSKVTVKGTMFHEIADKALSVGEQSEVKASHLAVEVAGTGFASKDKSRLELSDSTIGSVHLVALMAYVKKPEFGPASIQATNLVFEDGARIIRAQKGSEIVLDGKPVATEDIDVEQLYDTIMKPARRQ
jgi:hypothetical protein